GLAARRERALDWVAVVRVEQLYPFPAKELEAVFAAYPEARQVYWVQEEPWNMGAWHVMYRRLRRVLPEDRTLSYAGRPEAASPATGSFKLHLAEERDLVNFALARWDGCGGGGRHDVRGAHPDTRRVGDRGGHRALGEAGRRGGQAGRRPARARDRQGEHGASRRARRRAAHREARGREGRGRRAGGAHRGGRGRARRRAGGPEGAPRGARAPIRGARAGTEAGPG